MKIMFMADSLSDGGAERVTAMLVSRLVAEHDVSVYCLEKKEPEYPVAGSVRRYYYESSRQGIHKRIGELTFLYKAIKKEKPNVIVSLAGYIGNFLLEMANSLKRVPLILSERSDPYHYPARFRGRVLRNITYYLCDGIVFQTKGARKFFPQAIRRKSIIIMNPVKKPEVNRGTIHNKKIVNCSRLSPEKNLKLLIDAFCIVKKRFPEYELHIYGEGEERENLTEYIAKKRISDKVFLDGFLANIHEEIKDAAMYVSTSDYEGMSNSMLEALAIGIPTICTDCPSGGARMAIHTGKNGILVPVRDKKALVYAMELLVENQEYANELGRLGKKICISLSEKRITEKWTKYIVSVVSKHQK